MALMVADLDVEYEPDELLEEDLNAAALCQCPHPVGDHDPDVGCQSCASCSALGLRGLAGEDQDEDELDVVVVRIIAALKAARARRRKLEQDRDAATIERARPRASMVKRMPRVAPTKATVPKVATTKLKANLTEVRGKKGKVATPPADGYERAAWLSPDQEVLEAAGVLA